MELSPYLDGLRRDLRAAAAPGGPEVAHAAELLGGALESSARLCLLEALSDAAAEITTRLAGASVEVQLRGREAHLAVTPTGAAPSRPAGGFETEPGDLARMTLRLPESLKETIERAAAAEAISVNAWLVRILAQVVSGAAPGAASAPPGPASYQQPPGPASPGSASSPPGSASSPPGSASSPPASARRPGRARLGRRVTGHAQS